MAKTTVPKKSRLAAPPARVETPTNLETAADGRRHSKDLNFKVSETFHREVQTLAFMEKISMTELLRRMVSLYEETNGFNMKEIMGRFDR